MEIVEDVPALAMLVGEMRPQPQIKMTKLVWDVEADEIATPSVHLVFGDPSCDLETVAFGLAVLVDVPVSAQVHVERPEPAADLDPRGPVSGVPPGARPDVAEVVGAGVSVGAAPAVGRSLAFLVHPGRSQPGR